MQAHGGDRVRVVGEKIVLLSPIPKGWTARVPKQGTRSEHPGTAVLWEEQYFEVVTAERASNGFRYVLLPWRDEHTIRVFSAYDEASEAARVEDHASALRQQKASVAASLGSIFLGHLPAQVQEKIGNEYGIAPARMTLISTIPSLVLLGTCVWLYAEARLKMVPSPVPVWLWLVALFMFAESVVRYQVAMGQNRGMGSLEGIFVYIAIWLVAPKSMGLVSPFASEKGVSSSFMIDAPDEITLQDQLHVRAPLFTLLTPAEQIRLADRFGFEYRRHAYTPAIVILVCAGIGAYTSFNTLRGNGGLSALVSLVVAGGLTLEQIVRLMAFPRGPAGSVLRVLVRPLVQRFLR